MKKLRWQIFIAIFALGAIAVLLLGRKGGIGDIIFPESTSGGVYVEGLVGSPSRFNPLLDYYNQVDRDIDSLVFSSLIKFDSNGNPLPDLAESFGVSVTGDVFNVSLRKNVFWHDGIPFTAQDVLFTVNLLRNPEMPLPPDQVALWNSVEVIAFDALNIQFRLQEPYSPFIDYLSFGILPEHLFGGKSPEEIISDPFNLSPIGTGPYRFDELITEDGRIVGVILRANKDFYLESPFLEQVIFRYFESTAEALKAYEEGKILGIGQIDLESLDAVLAEPDLNVYTSRLPEMTIILLNLDHGEKPFFGDVEVRKALMMALNRPWMVDQALGGQAVVANGPIFPGTWAYYDDVYKTEYNPEEAIKIFKKAGYVLPGEGIIRENEGVQLSFDLVYPNTEKHTILAQMIQGYWAGVGVYVNIIPVDNETLLRDYLEPRTYQAALVDWTLARSPDPDPYPFWHQAMITGGQNYSKWDDRRASEYLENARVTPDRYERTRLYRNFQVHFSRELPALPLFYPMYSYAVKNEVLGIQLGPVFDPSDRFNTILDWYLQSKPKLEEGETVTEGQ